MWRSRIDLICLLAFNVGTTLHPSNQQLVSAPITQHLNQQNVMEGLPALVSILSTRFWAMPG